MGTNTYPFLEFEANAIFDPHVDHLYVNELEFDLIKGSLKLMLGEELVCTNAECYFNKRCNEVRR
jgi:hypothetical protein